MKNLARASCPPTSPCRSLLFFVCLLVLPCVVFGQGLVTRVDSIAITVADMDQSLEFYTEVLPFEKISDVEVAGTEYEHLEGLFGLRIRVVRLKLGDESIELIDFLAPEGRPVPVDSRSNDLWFQHIAMIVSDMDRA